MRRERKLKLISTTNEQKIYAPLAFKVVGEPVSKARSRPGPFGFITPTKTINYQNTVREQAYYALQFYKNQHGYAWNSSGHFALGITVFMSDGRARDLDNVCKAVLDGLQPERRKKGNVLSYPNYVYMDDRNVKSFWAHMFHYERQPRVEIVVRRMVDFGKLQKASERLLLEAV